MKLFSTLNLKCKALIAYICIYAYAYIYIVIVF